MIFRKGERVYWGAPEVIYLEGTVKALDEEKQTVTVLVDRATPRSSHLIGSEVPFTANGLKPLTGPSPSDTTTERATEQQTLPNLSDDEKIKRAATVAVHQQYGDTLAPEQKQALIEQVTQALNNDPQLRRQIIDSMNEIMRRTF